MKKLLATICVGGSCLISSCSLESPEVPPTDFVLSGQYDFEEADNSTVAGNLDGAYLTLSEDGTFSLTNPGWRTDELGEFDIVESGTYSFSELGEEDGFFTIDVTALTPPGLASLYLFHGGLNRLRYEISATTASEQLIIRVIYGTIKSWATFAKAIPLVLEGSYVFSSSSDEDLAEILAGAVLTFSSTEEFELTNPRDVQIAHAETTVHIVERGEFSTTTDSLTFDLYSQEPEGADSLYMLTPPSVTVPSYFEDGQLVLEFGDAIKSGTTFWTAPSTVEEVEPNDSRSEASALGGSGSYTALGTVSSGGIDGNEEYSGDLDYFSFVPGAEGNVAVQLAWSEAADLDLYLISDDGTTLASSAVAGQTGPEFIEAPVSEGLTYYVLAVSFDNPASYTISVNVP